MGGGSKTLRSPCWEVGGTDSGDIVPDEFWESGVVLPLVSEVSEDDGDGSDTGGGSGTALSLTFACSDGNDGSEVGGGSGGLELGLANWLGDE